MKLIHVNLHQTKVFNNNKQRWNNDNCRYEDKDLIDTGICDKRFICNTSKCEYESGKQCDVRERIFRI